MFQSLIGFKINWNEDYPAAYINRGKFQSLIGFKINWNNLSCRQLDPILGFQSLIGLKINWNELAVLGIAVEKEVSIPNRA